MRYLFFVLTAAFALALPLGALAGSGYNLHPSGFGQHSFAAWKAQQGTPDDQGNDNQALYFQKMTDTTTNAAGVAIITGLKGTAATELNGLSWWHREDGHCGAGAPRWDISVQDTSGNHFIVELLGCQSAQHTQETAMTNTFGWCKDSFSNAAIQSALTAGTGGENPSQLTITGLAIVFDEGNDAAETNQPPPGCAQQQTAPGFVYLDNIDVNVNGADHCWTSANDNGNTGSGACDPPAGATVTGSTINVGLPSGVAVDPTDTALVDALNAVEPDVPLTSWLLYPNVIN